MTFLFVDVETTGLDVNRDLLLEVAMVAADSSLKPFAEISRAVLPHGFGSWYDSIADDNFAWKLHNENGLIQELRSGRAHRPQDVSVQLLAFLDSVGLPPDTPLAGSNAQFDRNFLRRYMPQVEERFHYRNEDVSAIKQFVKRWAPSVTARLPEPMKLHRALPDCYDTIEELTYYKREIFDRVPVNVRVA